MCHESASGSTVMADAAGDVDPDAVTSRSWCIEDPDLIFLIVAHAEFQSLATIARICKSWRAAALRTDLPHWSECDESRFLALQRSILRRYSSEALIRVLRSKPRIGALDLTNLSASEGSSLHRMSAVLPATLHTLAVRPPEGRGRVRIEHPDVFLDALLARIEELPMLRSLDLTGILTERSLAGLRLQQRRRAKTADMREDDLTQGSPNVARLSFARALPRLEVLALGFHCFSVIGQREGLEYARSPLPNSPQPRPCSRPSHHPQPRPLLQTFTPPTASPPAPDVHTTHSLAPCSRPSHHPQPRPLLQTFTPPTGLAPPAPSAHAPLACALSPNVPTTSDVMTVLLDARACACAVLRHVSSGTSSSSSGWRRDCAVSAVWSTHRAARLWMSNAACAARCFTVGSKSTLCIRHSSRTSRVRAPDCV